MDLYNDSHEKVCILSGIKETCITSTLKTGDKEITFEFRKTNRYAADIKEEGYIRTDTDEFVIKQVEPSGEWYKCTGTLNVEELEGKQYPQGFETVEKTVDECLTEAIDGTGWKVIRCDVSKKRTIRIEQNTAPEGYDVPHPEKAWKPSRHGKVCINEGTSRKVRMIEKPRYNYEQVIHHIVVSACYDIFMKGMYEFSCGSVPNRGAHYGKKYIERWIQRDKKNCKYVLKMDIRHFFESVDHDVLKAWLKKKIRDERMLYILELIIDGSEVGLPLGFYTSQWLSNFMLQPLDHFIKEQLKAVHYIRYMDDMVVFGKNKKELHRMQQEIERFLREKFNLQMKGNWQVFRFDYTEKKTGKRKGRPLDFMGFQFYHDKTILRESIMLSCTRKVNRVAKKEKITWYDATAILSYMGYLSNTDTYDMYLQRVKPYVNVKKLKKIVSKHSKRKEREKHERMERSVRNGGRTAGGVRHNSITDNGISETQYQKSNERGCRRKENHRMAARGA